MVHTLLLFEWHITLSNELYYSQRICHVFVNIGINYWLILKGQSTYWTYLKLLSKISFTSDLIIIYRYLCHHWKNITRPSPFHNTPVTLKNALGNKRDPLDFQQFFIVFFTQACQCFEIDLTGCCPLNADKFLYLPSLFLKLFFSFELSIITHWECRTVLE